MTCTCGHDREMHTAGTGRWQCWATVDDGHSRHKQPKEARCRCREFVAAPDAPDPPRAKRRRWAVAVAIMSVVSIVNIVVAALVEPMAARMFCASAAWAAGAVTMFCIAQGVEEGA